jgi:hypothetical protein
MTRFLKGFQFGTPHRKGSQFGTPLQEGVSIWHPLYEQGVSIWHPFTSRGSNLAPLVGPNDTQVTRIDTHPVPSFFPESSLQVEARISLDTRPVGNNHLFGQQDHSRFLFFLKPFVIYYTVVNLREIVIHPNIGWNFSQESQLIYMYLIGL